MGDPKCTIFVGAALMPIANGDLAHPRTIAGRLQLQGQSSQSTVVPNASVSKCCRALRSAATWVAAAGREQKIRSGQPRRRPKTKKCKGTVTAASQKQKSAGAQPPRPAEKIKVQVHSRGGRAFAPLFFRWPPRPMLLQLAFAPRPPRPFFFWQTRHPPQKKCGSIGFQCFVLQVWEGFFHETCSCGSGGQEMGTAQVGTERLHKNTLQQLIAGGVQFVEDLGLVKTLRGGHFSQHEAACGAERAQTTGAQRFFFFCVEVRTLASRERDKPHPPSPSSSLPLSLLRQ